jgi:hypothetical protein
MAITVYVGPTAGGGGNALYASQDLGTALAPWNGSTGAGPSAAAYLYGFADASQRARFFYSSSANAIALPTLVVPPVVPLNFVNCGNSASLGAVYQLVQTGSDYGATVAGNGPFLVTLSFSAGSPDSASPFQFTLDMGAILIVSDQAYQGL